MEKLKDLEKKYEEKRKELDQIRNEIEETQLSLTKIDLQNQFIFLGGGLYTGYYYVQDMWYSKASHTGAKEPEVVMECIGFNSRWTSESDDSFSWFDAWKQIYIPLRYFQSNMAKNIKILSKEEFLREYNKAIEKTKKNFSEWVEKITKQKTEQK